MATTPDNISRLHTSMSSPAENGFLVTPNDGANLSETTKAILLGVAGDLQVTLSGMKDGTSIVLPCPAGYNPLRVARVWATSTTATGIVGLT